MQSPPVIAFHTLGCKLNQAESEILACEAVEAGYRIGGRNNADIHVINTCTVTHIADRKSRHLVRMLRRQNPDALIIVTGCYAERDARELLRAGADYAADNEGKMQVMELVNSAVLPRSDGITEYNDSRQDARIRSFLKIQDGCNDYCAYCIVPLVRSTRYSVPVAEVLDTVNRRVSDGYKEVVLTGTKIGAYRDRDIDLNRLVQQILADTEIERLHLSSLQPQEISRDMLALWQNPRMYRHFHLALQSGSEAVLKRMKRRYSLADYANVVSLVRQAVPDASVTTDIMVGFPGESDAEFEESYRFCRDMEFADIHVFSYSSRPGTAAAAMDGQVADKIKKERSNRMLDLARESSIKFRERFLGQTRTVLWENEESKRQGLYSGLTDNYIRVFAESERILTNSLLPVRLVGLCKNGLKGELS
jgi:threonylcarbamoyladenosine tRNA methylthiotransferase MtaB